MGRKGSLTGVAAAVTPLGQVPALLGPSPGFHTAAARQVLDHIGPYKPGAHHEGRRLDRGILRTTPYTCSVNCFSPCPFSMIQASSVLPRSTPRRKRWAAMVVQAARLEQQSINSSLSLVTISSPSSGQISTPLSPLSSTPRPINHFLPLPAMAAFARVEHQSSCTACRRVSKCLFRDRNSTTYT